MAPMRWLAGFAALACAGSLLAYFAAATRPEPIAFEDIAERAGVDFVLRNSATPERHQIETMVGGVAVFDYNNDGRPDLYFVNGAHQPALDKPDPSWFNRLYFNGYISPPQINEHNAAGPVHWRFCGVPSNYKPAGAPLLPYGATSASQRTRWD
jgi:hypothetical protein